MNQILQYLIENGPQTGTLSDYNAHVKYTPLMDCQRCIPISKNCVILLALNNRLLWSKWLICTHFQCMVLTTRKHIPLITSIQVIGCWWANRTPSRVHFISSRDVFSGFWWVNPMLPVEPVLTWAENQKLIIFFNT